MHLKLAKRSDMETVLKEVHSRMVMIDVSCSYYSLSLNTLSMHNIFLKIKQRQQLFWVEESRKCIICDGLGLSNLLLSKVLN